MKVNIKTNIALFCGAFLAVTTAGCSDWDDHYEGGSDGNTAATATLWQNISSKSELSQFAELVKKGGYDELLNTSQTYTVWAPSNGSFNYDELLNTTDTRLRHEFLSNHIARSNYLASGDVRKKVMLLNEKFKTFNGNGQYTMGGVSVDEANLPNINGTLHVIDGKLSFMSNIYEYLTDENNGLDSISDYYKHYEVKILDTENSVQGPTVNGEITYLDSVIIESNRLFSSYIGRAYINEEDSNYTMLLPTNKAWNEGLAKVKSYFNYIPRMWVATYDANATQGREQITLNDVYMKDSLSHYNMINNLIFNNNIYGNGTWLTGNGMPTGIDSLVTTSRNVIYGKAADDIFVGAQKVEMSNGYGWVTDSLRIKPWYAWCQPIKLEGESSGRRAATKNSGTVRTINLNTTGKNPNIEGAVSDNRYLEISPEATYANPEVYYYLPNILSTTYNVYAVIVPNNIRNSSTKPLPNKLKLEIGYTEADGSLKTKSFDGTLTNDTSKIDTISFGSIDFPVSYSGLNYSPYLRLRSFATRSDISGKKADNTLRIDCILLVPKELDDYIKETGESYPGLY